MRWRYEIYGFFPGLINYLFLLRSCNFRVTRVTWCCVNIWAISCWLLNWFLWLIVLNLIFFRNSEYISFLTSLRIDLLIKGCFKVGLVLNRLTFHKIYIIRKFWTILKRYFSWHECFSCSGVAAVFLATLLNAVFFVRRVSRTPMKIILLCLIRFLTICKCVNTTQ